MNRTERQRLAEALYEKSCSTGGATVWRNGADVYHDGHGAGLWCVGGRTPSCVVSRFRRDRSETIRQVAEWLKSNPSTVYGAWVNLNDLHIDCVDLVDGQNEAEMLGRSRGELAIFQLGTNQEVSLTDEAPVHCGTYAELTDDGAWMCPCCGAAQ